MGDISRYAIRTTSSTVMMIKYRATRRNDGKKKKTTRYYEIIICMRGCDNIERRHHHNITQYTTITRMSASTTTSSSAAAAATAAAASSTSATASSSSNHHDDDGTAASVYQDLIQFLQSPRQDLRLEATKAVLQVVQDRNQVLALLEHGVLLPLLWILSDNSTANLDSAINASRAILYMTSTSTSTSSATSASASYHSVPISMVDKHQEVTTSTNITSCVEELLEHKAVGRLIELVLSTTPSTTTNNNQNKHHHKNENHNNDNNNDNNNNNKNNTLINLALAILANLTRTEEGAVELVGKTLPDYAVPKEEEEAVIAKSTERPTLLLLLDRFLNRDYYYITTAPLSSSSSSSSRLTTYTINEEEPSPSSQLSSSSPTTNTNHEEWDTQSNDPYQHFSAILMNITQLESGRKFVLRTGGGESMEQQQQQQQQQHQGSNKNTHQRRSVLETLLPQLASSSPNPIRRRGISGMIRNCCLEKEAAWWMLNIAKVLTPLLMPLAGPEELDWDEKQGMDPDLWLPGPDKIREIDTTTRQHCVEALLLLCASGRQSRKTLRLARTYVVLKYADMVEESETVSERINECVQYLRRDEEGTQEGSSDQMVEEELATTTSSSTSSQLNKLLLLPSSEIIQKEATADHDYDDVD